MQAGAASEKQTEDPARWQAWDEFLEPRTDAGFRQSSWYAGFRAAHNGWMHFAAVLRDGGAIVGGAVVFRRSFAPGKCFYYVPDGPVLLEEDSEAEQEQVFRGILSFIDAKRREEERVVSHLCVIPRWECVPGFAREFQPSSHFYGVPRYTQCIDLTISESDILAQMKPKGRYNIGVARRYGVSVAEDASAQGIEDFLEIYEETFTRKGLEGQEPEYFRTLIPSLSASGRGSVFFAEYQGVRLATAIVLHFGHTATYYYGGSRSADRHVMAPYLLHFNIMRRAKALGCQLYDLMGVTPQGEPSNGWTGFSVFKRKFGGRELRLTPALEYVYDPGVYREWSAVEQERRRARHERLAVSH